MGVIGICQHRISCIVGVHPQERQKEQMLIVDLKIKTDFSHCLKTSDVSDTVNYVMLAQLCTDLAVKNKYLLIEVFASDILDECLHRFPAEWAFVRVQKPSAIPSAAYAFIELERGRNSCGR